MKKFLCLILVLNFFSSNVSYAMIHDTFAETTLNKNLQIQEYKKEIITDNLITASFIQKHQNKLYTNKVTIVDDFANKNLAKYKNEKLISYKPISFENFQKTSIKIKPLKNITTKDKSLKEGSTIDFILTEDFYYNKKLFKKGSKIKATVENISLNEAFGMPANLELGQFKINNTRFDNNLKINGANRATWVIPVGYIGCCFFGVGILIFPIRGGHAKLKTHKIYNLVVNDFS